MSIKAKLKSNRISAFLLALVMIVSAIAGGILPTYADPGDVSVWQPIYKGTIYGGFDDDDMQVEDEYLYANSSAEMAADTYRSAYKFDDEFFVYATGAIGNVFYNLASNGQLGRYVGGGEDFNPARADVPVIFNTASTNSAYRVFLAGPYTTTQGQIFYYMDAPDSNTQGAVRDGNLQGPETSTPKTDVTVILNGDGSITVTPTPLVPGEPSELFGPDDDGNYYKPVGVPPNVYEVVDEDGDPKDNPPKYILDPNTDGDNDPSTGTDPNLPVTKQDGTPKDKYYVETPANIYHELDDNGSYDPNNGIWGGEDGKLGGTDDEDAVKKSGSWFADMGQNIFKPIEGNTSGDLVGGGFDKNPTTKPARPVYYDEANDKYYIGPLQDNKGNDYYYGDPATDGNGLVDSEADRIQGDDEVWYKAADGSMTQTEPDYLPEGVIQVGDDFWKLIPEAGNGTDIYGKVAVNGQTTTPILDGDGVKIIVDQTSKIPTDKPTMADDRWYDVDDLDDSVIDPSEYDLNNDGYLNPTEYANYLSAVENAGTTTRQDLNSAGFLVVAYANANGEITGWNGAGYENAAYALVVTENAIPGGASTRADLQNRIDTWFYEQCPSSIRSAVAGVKFSGDYSSQFAYVTGISTVDPGNVPRAFALSAAEADKWTNRSFNTRTWTRSFYSYTTTWFLSATNGALASDSASGTADIRAAMWVNLADPTYLVSNLPVGAAPYDYNGDGRINATEYANYQAGIIADPGKVTTSDINKAGFTLLAYADASGEITGWNGVGLAGAKYALILSNTMVAGPATARGLMQGEINTWFANACPANIRNAAARVIFSGEYTSQFAYVTGISKVDAGGDIIAFALSAAELDKVWQGTRSFAERTWTRSYYGYTTAWVVSAVDGNLGDVANTVSAHIRPAVWVQIA